MEIVKLLLDQNGIDINKRTGRAAKNIKYTPLNLAINKGNIEMVKLLLAQKGIDINKRTAGWEANFTPLHLAVDKDQIEIVKLLLEQDGLKVNETCRIICFVDLKFVLNNLYLFKKFFTPLHLAVFHDQIEIVKLLLEHKDIDIKKKTMKRKTALMMAKERNDTEIVDLIQSKLKVSKNV